MSDLVKQLRLGLVIADAIAVGEAMGARIRQLKHEDPSVRQKAAEELGRGLVTPAGAVNPLIEALRDPEWTVREAAAGALGYYWRQRRRAIPSLLDLLSDERVEVQESAILALIRLGYRPARIETAMRSCADVFDAGICSQVVSFILTGKKDPH
jgi:HEAT repeat protein